MTYNRFLAKWQHITSSLSKTGPGLHWFSSTSLLFINTSQVGCTCSRHYIFPHIYRQSFLMPSVQGMIFYRNQVSVFSNTFSLIMDHVLPFCWESVFSYLIKYFMDLHSNLGMVIVPFQMKPLSKSSFLPEDTESQQGSFAGNISVQIWNISNQFEMQQYMEI